MNSFGVAVFLALGAAVISAKPTKEQLKEALNTEEKIWTVLRSYQRNGSHGENTCVYAKKLGLEQDNYKFEQGFKSGSELKKHILHGKLSQQGNDAVLTVKTNPDEGPGIEYTLQYWDTDKKCGVLTFKEGNNAELRCELHLWEQNLHWNTNDLSCKEEYKKICKNKPEFPVDTNDCPREVQEQ